MYAIDPSDGFKSISRRPRNAHQLEGEGWLFLSCHRPWDSAERERLSLATGLHALSPTYGEGASQDWWEAFARSYLLLGDAVSAIQNIGEPAGAPWVAGRSVDNQSFDPWRNSCWHPWYLEIPAADLIPMINVHFILRLLGHSAKLAQSEFAEFTLAKSRRGLSVRHDGGAFDVPAAGWWPSPIATSCRNFIRVVREVTSDYITMRYYGGGLHIADARLQAREL